MAEIGKIHTDTEDGKDFPEEDLWEEALSGLRIRTNQILANAAPGNTTAATAEALADVLQQLLDLRKDLDRTSDPSGGRTLTAVATAIDGMIDEIGDSATELGLPLARAVSRRAQFRPKNL